MTKLKILLVIYGFFSLSGCDNHEDCSPGYREGEKYMTQYFATKDCVQLIQALAVFSQFDGCSIEAKKWFVERKISILLLLGRFESGRKFLDSVNERFFTYSYQKEVTANYFEAQQCNIMGKIAVRDSLYKKNVDVIESFIATRHYDSSNLDEKVYYDLIFQKNKVLSKEQLNTEIETMAARYPTKSRFFEALKGSFDDIPTDNKIY